MKKFGILILAMAVLSVMTLVSCGEIATGGTITVKNNYPSKKDPVLNTELNVAKVKIYKGIDVTKTPIKQDDVQPNSYKSFIFDEDGVYTVTHLLPGEIDTWITFPDIKPLLAGNKQTVEINPEE